MKWTALNGVGAIFWLVGLYLAVGVSQEGHWGFWLPANALPVGAVLGLVGLATLLWANLSGA